MSARMTNPAQLLPDAMTAIPHLLGAAEQGGLSKELRELVCLRVSQINGCSACVHAHAKTLQAEGVADEKIFGVTAWHESPFFGEEERAALRLAEAATRLADAPREAVSDAVWNEAADLFDEKALASLVLTVATINFFNRINVTIQEPAGTVW
ncbi:carboxymuconolactone decarboxylase family protein [Rhodococcus sp. HNM0569]|uniref:carboxymuconolactone decarboxylase family protein n=1 Tax=Rhodococcus sp. HNM0569 TaxID=2716340 RepID=UPI00146E1D25|nr:carboxymuconolactone decarboxylase family protein [Rhodococcus sp. HNM0569]NLU83639.1 carboxymuconolactone decarboxylase family protein [Rhodococcus sp. HNM0569]